MIRDMGYSRWNGQGCLPEKVPLEGTPLRRREGVRHAVAMRNGVSGAEWQG